MPEDRFSVWLESYRGDLKQKLRQAGADNFRLLEASIARPELNPADLGRSARRHLSRYLQDLGTRIDSIALPLPRLGLADPQGGDEALTRFRLMLELCRELGAPRAGVSLAGFADERTAGFAREMLAAVADLADRHSVQVAVHSPMEDPALVAEEIRRLDAPLVRLGVDAARLSAESSAADWAEQLGALHLRDARRAAERIEEVDWGQGDVDFVKILSEAEARGYANPLCIRQDAPGVGVDALRRGREYIRTLLDRAPRL